MINSRNELFFSIMLIFFACDKKDLEITPINPIKLPESYETYRIEIGYYDNYFIVDSFLIMAARHEDKIIHVYNKNNLQLITKFGSRGMAHFDLLKVNPLSTIQDSDSIFYYDSQIWHYKTINLKKFFLEGNISDCISSIQMDRDLFFNSNLKMLDNYRFAGICERLDQAVRKDMFFIYDTRKKEMKGIKNVPKTRKGKDLHKGFLDVNSLKNTIVFATRFFDQVLFYDFEGNLFKQHIFSPLKIPTLNRENYPVLPGSFVYGMGTYATPNYCFIYRRGVRTTDSPTLPLPPSQLLVFNWEGLLINTFEINNAQFCYDEEYGYLYTFESSKEENDIYSTVRKYYIGDHLQTN